MHINDQILYISAVFKPNVMNVDSLMCHFNTVPTVLHPMQQTVNQPNDRYMCKLGLEPGSMHSPRSQVQYSIDYAKPAHTPYVATTILMFLIYPKRTLFLRHTLIKQCFNVYVTEMDH